MEEASSIITPLGEAKNIGATMDHAD